MEAPSLSSFFYCWFFVTLSKTVNDGLTESLTFDMLSLLWLNRDVMYSVLSIN